MFNPFAAGHPPIFRTPEVPGKCRVKFPPVPTSTPVPAAILCQTLHIVFHKNVAVNLCQ